VKTPVPGVLRSWAHLRATQGIAAPAVLPIQQEGTTYTMAQELEWVDSQHFAVGRWDGSLSIFEFSSSPMTGPVIAEAVSSPSSEGVQMITRLTANRFVSSNDDASCTVWFSASGGWSDLEVDATLTFPGSLGVANAGVSFPSTTGQGILLLIGHANGYVTLWLGAPDGTQLSLELTINVRVSQPLNPWGLQNVRGLAWLAADEAGYQYVVSGSENGYLSVIRSDGAMLSQTPYNPAAQRGINSLATLGSSLLVANCMVGQDDFNLWLYSVDFRTWAISVQDSTKLQVDPSLAQVFNFDVIWGYYSGGVCWFSATEEGYLWMGTVGSGGSSLEILGNQQITGPLGAALGMATNGNLAAVSYDLYEFNTTPSDAGVPDPNHPARWWVPVR
jgi:hypothetical protein